jgi:glycosyltransferase involved in cell wall biosynthesis
MISVIVAVHNSAGSLSRCLKAVAASGYPTYECIVVDDGSTDGTRAIATESYVHVVELAGGPFGPAYARNRAAEAVQGEILDADVFV